MANRLVFLGTGTGVPDGRRLPTALLLELEGRSWVLDLGPGILHRAVRHLGLSIIRRILITHFHLDHTADLAALFFALHNTPDPPPFLEIIGPSGLEAFLKRLLKPWRLHLPKGRLSLLEVPPGTALAFGSVRIVPFPTHHTPESQGYRIDHPDYSLAYTGDTGYHPELATWLQGLDLLITEVSFLHPAEGHLSPSEAARLAVEAGTRHLAVVHRYPGVSVSRLRRALQELLPEGVRLWIPADGEEFPLRRLKESGA